MKFLSNEKLFKSVCLFMMTLTGISILVGTQLMKIILSVALGLFVVYALLNLNDRGKLVFSCHEVLNLLTLQGFGFFFFPSFYTLPFSLLNLYQRYCYTQNHCKEERSIWILTVVI